MVGLAGAWIVGVDWLGIQGYWFFENMQKYTKNFDMGTGVVKTTAFGAVIALVCCYKGFHCTGGAEGETPTWDDCISSVKVMPGWSATLYRDTNYKGASVTITSDTPNLKALAGCGKDGFNDCVSSIRVARAGP